MRTIWCALLILTMTLPLICQSADTGWTVGTVMSVKKQPQKDSTPARFEVTVRVLDTDYVCAYTQESDTIGAEYTVGRDAPVRVKDNILMFRNKLGKITELQIISRTRVDKAKKQ